MTQSQIDQLMAEYMQQAAERKQRMGRDYWDRRIEREQGKPVIAACPKPGPQSK